MYNYELVKAAIKLLRDCFNIKKGDSVVITSDTLSNMEVVEATAQAAYALGGKPMTVNMAAPRGVGKVGDIDMPIKPLAGALENADIWIEYNEMWLLYSTVFDQAVANNKNLKYMCLVGMNPDLMIRNIGRVNNVALGKFLEKTEEITMKSKHVRITTSAGCDIEFEHVPGRDFYTSTGIVGDGEWKMMAGQISWSPEFASINGTIVFDGSINPPIGLVNEPVKLTVKNGYIKNITGGNEARELQDWIESFDDPEMYRIAHLSYGFNPGAKLTGDVVEDERVWGSTEWGIGNVGPQLVSDLPAGLDAASHSDGICMNSTVYLDGKIFLKDGEVVGPTEEIIKLAKVAKELEYS
jgi:leucyl aminopeptidase (aminopeptidase T)